MTRRLPELTPAQRELYDSLPGLAEDVVTAAVREHGRGLLRGLERGELISIAVVGAMGSMATFDPEKKASPSGWAFFNAMHAVLRAGHKEKRRYVKARALITATVMTFFAEAEAEVEIGVDTEASSSGKLDGLCNRAVVLALQEVAAMEPAVGGEDEMIEREASARTAAALREVLPPAGSEDRQILEMHFRDRMPWTEVAAHFGATSGAQYRAFVRRAEKVLAKVARRLAAQGVTERPADLEDVWD